jgi:hypothetical protein
LIPNKTPFESWASMQLDLCHLCVFGCLAYELCQMKNDKNLTQKHTNAFWLAMRNDMVLNVTICMIKPHIDSL